MMEFKKSIAIVIPVYNDWPSLECLISAIGEQCAEFEATPSLYLINDASPVEPPEDFLKALNLANFRSVEIFDLAYNSGHQAAIAVGLSAVSELGTWDYVVVMDSDGEDRPTDLSLMLKAADGHANHIIVAERAERSEGLTFRFFYYFYKFFFQSLTGKSINFGNFSIVPGSLLARFVLMPDLQNNYAASILKSRFPVFRLPTRRGVRYVGKSSMNLLSLVIHGLSAIAVFRENAFVRLILLAGMIGIAVLFGIAIVLGIRLFTNLAIPGWASYMTAFFSLVLLQAGMMLLIAVFLSRGNRNLEPITPDVLVSRMIIGRRKIH